MDFSAELDRALRGEAPQAHDLSLEDRALLEFATLIRARQAGTPAAQRRRLLQRLQPQTSRRRPVPALRQRLAVGLAALLAMALGLSWATAPTPFTRARLDRGLAQATGMADPSRSQQVAAARDHKPREALRPLAMAPAPLVDEFEQSGFPTPDPAVAPALGGTVETGLYKDAARLLRLHGLVMLQAQGEQRWRVARRGEVLRVGDRLRTSPRLDSATRVLAPDGSVLAIGPASSALYRGPRAWELSLGTARFEVAKRPDLAPFSVRTPHGEAKALGTEFMLSVATAPAPAGGQTVCWVRDGRVALAAHSAQTLELAAGKSGLAHQSGVEPGRLEPATGWLAALEGELASEHGLGRLVAQTEKDAEQMPLEVKRYAVTVTAIEQVARTFVDMVFVNTTSRRLEGTFYYPLPPDASIGEFNLFVNDKLVRGEVLEQHRARQVFEYIVRQQRDPALLEFAGGNLFKMRVFPIEPHSEKRIQLGYTQVLPRSDAQVTYTFPLYSEMLLKNPLRDLSLEFRVASSHGLEDLRSPTHLCASKLNPDRTRGTVSFSARNYSPGTDFCVTYKVPQAPECVALANARPDEAQAYFMLQLCPRAQLPPPPQPERLLLIVDGSASAAAQEYAIASEFAATAVDLSADYEFALLRGGQRPEAFKPAFSLSDAQTSQQVREYLGKQPPLGATDLLRTFAAAARLVPPGKSAQLVYLGDGIETVSELAGPALVQAIAALFAGKNVQLSTVATGSNYDADVLQGLAAALGGTFTRVEGAEGIAGAADAVLYGFTRPVFRNLRLRFEGLTASAVYPPLLGTLCAKDTSIVFGRLDSGTKGRLHLTGEAAGQPFSRAYDLDLEANQERNRFIPRLWARAHMRALLGQLGLADPGRDSQLRQQVIESSLAYQIISPLTAFLALESEGDYARYGIQRRMKMWDWRGEEDLSSSDRVARGGKTTLFAAGRISGPLGKAMKENVSTSEPSAEAAAGDHFETIDYLGVLGNGRFDGVEDFDSEQMGQESGQDFLAREEKSFKPPSDPPSKPGSDEWGEAPASRVDPFWSLGKLRAATTSRGRRIMGGPIPYRYSGQPSLVLGPGARLVDLAVDQPLRPEPEYRRILALGQGTLSTRLNHALALEGLGRYSAALKALAAVLEALPALPELWLEAGVIRYRLQDAAGGAESFKKALDLTPQKGQAEVAVRIAGLLGNLGRHQEAAERYARLVQTAHDPAQAAQWAASASQSFQHANQPEQEEALWDSVLKRWPEAAPVLAGAGQWLLSTRRDPSRAVELLASARKAGAPAIAPSLIQALYSAGRAEQARLELHSQLQGCDGDGCFALLASIHSQDREYARGIALERLHAPKGVAQQAAALRYLTSYQPGWPTEAQDLIAALLADERTEFQARVLALQFLVQQGQKTGQRPELRRWVESLVNRARTPAERQQLIALPQSLTYHAPAAALVLADRLLQRQDLEAPPRLQLQQARIQILGHLQRHPEAQAQAAEVLRMAPDDSAAYGAVWTVFQNGLNRGAWEAAADIALEFGTRFKESASLEQFFRPLLDARRRTMQQEAYRVWVAKLAALQPWNNFLQEQKVRILAEGGDWRAAAEGARAAFQSIQERIAVAASAVRTNQPLLQVDPPGGQELPSPKPEAAAKARARLELLKTQRAAWLTLLARISSRDAGLCREFLQTAASHTGAADETAREWTAATLSALRGSGDLTAYTAKLEELHAAEPDDPDWGSALAEAYVCARRFKEARALLEQLSSREPENQDLALRLIELSLRMKDPAGAERHLEKWLTFAETEHWSIQQMASSWQQNRPDWALKCWRALARSGPYARNGYPQYQSAQLLLNTGREEEALRCYLELLTRQDLDGSYLQQALNGISGLLQQEALLRLTETEVRRLLGKPPQDSRRLCVLLLLHRIEKLKNDHSAARSALEQAAKVPLHATGYLLGVEVARAFCAEELWDRAEVYATEQKSLEPSQRRYLIQSIASSMQDQPGRELRLWRALLKSSDPEPDQTRGRIVQILAGSGQLREAEAEVRLLKNEQQAWNIGNAWQALIEAYRNRGEHARALDLLAELWHLPYLNDSYRYQSDHLAWRICSEILGNPKLGADLQAKAVQFLRGWAREYFAGQGPNWNFPYSIQEQVKSAIDPLARDAGASDQAERVRRAACYWHHRGDFLEAKRLYRRALSLPTNAQSQIQQELFQLLSNPSAQPEYENALELLETLHQQQTFDDRSYYEWRAKCLYKINRTSEARVAIRAALPWSRQQGSWWLESLARTCEEAKDWTTAAEVFEVAIRRMQAETARRPQPDRIANLFQACANVYREAGEAEKGLDCYLRALSLIPRQDPNLQSYYQQLLKEATRNALNGKELEEAVAAYEARTRQSGGIERPNLRIVFGEAYRKAGQTRAMLEQFRIAANLLPKDLPLRQEVIQGFVALGDHEAALAAYHEWARFDPQNIECYRGLGDLLQRLKRTDEALLAWATMAEVRPREAEGYAAYAEKLLSLGRPAEAAAALRKAVSHRPGEFPIARQLAKVYQDTGETGRIPGLWVAGEAACRESLENLPDDPAPWLNLALYLREQGRPQEARDLYLKILARTWPRFQRETCDEARKELRMLDEH